MSMRGFSFSNSPKEDVLEFESRSMGFSALAPMCVGIETEDQLSSAANKHAQISIDWRAFKYIILRKNSPGALSINMRLVTVLVRKGLERTAY